MTSSFMLEGFELVSDANLRKKRLFSFYFVVQLQNPTMVQSVDSLFDEIEWRSLNRKNNIINPNIPGSFRTGYTRLVYITGVQVKRQLVNNVGQVVERTR